MSYSGLQFGPVPNKWGVGDMAIPAPNAQPPYVGDFMGSYVSMTPYMRGDFVPVYMMKQPPRKAVSIFGGSYGALPVVGLRSGARGAQVEDLQRALEKFGYSLGPDGVDGKFENHTEWALTMFQQDNGLEQNGVVDTATRAKMKEKLADPPSTRDKLLGLGLEIIPQLFDKPAPAAAAPSASFQPYVPPPTDYKPLIFAVVGLAAITGVLVLATRKG